eukprot:XP_014771450.1 PREDICTED: neurogenic locus protein delta-like [Octopus bimaculoides]
MPPIQVGLHNADCYNQSFTLSVEAWHDNLRNRTLRDPRYMIQRVVDTNIVKPSHKWVKKVMRSNITMMSFEYRVVCKKNYYGEACDHFCRVRDDELGHYYCTENGTLKCMDGWKGTYCDQAICPEQCHNSYGSCKKPKECSCRFGWEGEFCTKCKKDPNCLHGICYEPWQCICEPGWTGFLCNIDQNYCSKYGPCENGGTCKFDPSSNYTCSCPPSFKGSNCFSTNFERLASNRFVVIKYSFKDEDSYFLLFATLHRMPVVRFLRFSLSYKEIHTGYRCHCAEGFYGDRCENHVRSCDKIVCKNHGTCVTGEVGGWCACPKGFTGDFCEKEINECQSSPCQNGGICVEYFNDYACDCRSDYGGKNCELYLPCPCKNGGTCIGLSQCKCRDGFTGRRCEIVINKCKRLHCKNGGTCLSYAREGREECICPLGITGSECQYKDYCVQKPCLNGGTCRYHKRQRSFKCSCSSEFNGNWCQYDKRTAPQIRNEPGSSIMPLFISEQSFRGEKSFTGERSLTRKQPMSRGNSVFSFAKLIYFLPFLTLNIRLMVCDI